MIAVDHFRDRTVGIYGLTRPGLAAARALRQGGARVIAWDDSEAARLAAAHEGVTLDPYDRWPWSGIAAAIFSPGVLLTQPEPHAIARRARSVGAEIIGDIELFARAIRPEEGAKGAPVIAITGASGKSTTTALIGHILQSCGFDAQVGGNIGRPALELSPAKAKTVYVLELSSRQAELSPGLAPDVALLTNLSPGHAGRRAAMADEATVTESLLAHAAPDGHVVAGVDDPLSAAIYTKLAAQRGSSAVAVSVGKVLGRGVFVVDGKLYDAWDKPATLIGDLNAASRLPGAHNWQNAALAYAAVKRQVRDPRAIFNAIVRFPGLAHRMEHVGRIGKVHFINDSKAASTGAASRALACYTDIYWIGGGRPREEGIGSLDLFFPRLRRAYLIGEAAESFGSTLDGKVEAVRSGTLNRALAAAFDDARTGDAADPVVLFSPACAPFDQFRDYEQRGEVFREMVRGLIHAFPTPAKTEARA